MTRSTFVRSLAAAFAITLSAGSGCIFFDEPCDETRRVCDEVCSQSCDAWGCWVECWPECWDECVEYHESVVTPGAVPISCSSDADCAAGLRCDASRHCTAATAGNAGLCQACSTSGDCVESGALCLQFSTQATSGWCGRDCSGGTECPDGFECLAAGSARQCVPVTRSCAGRVEVPECAGDADCDPDEFCDASHCAARPTDCETDRECAPPDICLSSACQPPPPACAGDTDCSEGERCERGYCTELPPEG